MSSVSCIPHQNISRLKVHLPDIILDEKAAQHALNLLPMIGLNVINLFNRRNSPRLFLPKRQHFEPNVVTQIESHFMLADKMTFISQVK